MYVYSSQYCFSLKILTETFLLYIGKQDAPSPKNLMNEVAAVIPSKWKAVGYQLSISNGTLDSIQMNHAGKPQACHHSFEEVFRTWKDQATTAATCSPYTWQTIIDALKTPAVGEVALAESLEQKHK